MCCKYIHCRTSDTVRYKANFKTASTSDAVDLGKVGPVRSWSGPTLKCSAQNSKLVAQCMLGLELLLGTHKVRPDSRSGPVRRRDRNPTTLLAKTSDAD